MYKSKATVTSFMAYLFILSLLVKENEHVPKNPFHDFHYTSFKTTHVHLCD